MSGNFIGKKYLGQASITVSVTSKEEYSVSEYQATFTIPTPSLDRKLSLKNEDTDIEEDDDFLEYSEVTEQEQSGTSNCPPSYHSYKSKPKQLATPATASASASWSTSSPRPERKKSKYGAEASLRSKPLEGCWSLVGSVRYREFLASVGVPRYSRDLVMSSSLLLRIRQEPDRQWRLSTETIIRAKSVKGYRTTNRKWTENKFKAEEAKPEVLEDWDPRFVVTTLTASQAGDCMVLNQVAEKDMRYRQDSLVEMEIDDQDENILIITSSTDTATGWRKFERQNY